MFGDNFYAEFQVETVYNSGNFPNKLQLVLVDGNGMQELIGDKCNPEYKPKYGVVTNVNYLPGVSNPDKADSLLNKVMLGFGEFHNSINTIGSLSDLTIDGDITTDGTYSGAFFSANTNAKYAFAIGYDAPTREFAFFFYSYNGSKYNYNGSIKYILKNDISSGYHFELTCFDTVNDPYKDAPCVNVKANFGSEEFLFPDIAEPYQYEMKELHITENPDIDVYINDKGPKTDTVKVRKGSDVKIEAKAKDESLQDYVRIYVTPES